jgi:hypothetical protein
LVSFNKWNIVGIVFNLKANDVSTMRGGGVA